MARSKGRKNTKEPIPTNNSIEANLWDAANKMRSNLHASEFKNVVLGLVFLKYLSDVFYHTQKLIKKNKGSNIEDRDEYAVMGVFYVPKKARWDVLRDSAKDPNIGVLVDEALNAIEKENESLRGALQKNYARPELDKKILGGLIDQFSKITIRKDSGDSNDVLGRVYEYFLGRFGAAEGKRAGEFYTPRSIVDLLVAMLEPYKGRVYDPCCGSGGMFVQSERFVKERGGNITEITIRGQESTHATWCLCKMNMVMHRLIDADIKYANSFTDDKHKDLKADYILANPPFNQKDWGRDMLENDVRWKYGKPPKNNANYAWVQHIIHHLSPNGRAGFVLANGSLSASQSGEGDIRKNIVTADLVDCMVALPGALFYNTQIPACLWFLNRKKTAKIKYKILFIDARDLGHMINRRHRKLATDDIEKISSTYRAWCKQSGYADVPGFCKSVKIDDIDADYILTPGRYVGIEEKEEDQESFDEKMNGLISQLLKHMDESKKLDKEIQKNLKGIGYG